MYHFFGRNEQGKLLSDIEVRDNVRNMTITINVPDFQAIYIYLAPLNDCEVVVFGGE